MGFLGSNFSWSCHPWAQIFTSHDEDIFLSSLPFNTNKMGTAKEILKYILHKDCENILLFNKIKEFKILSDTCK